MEDENEYKKLPTEEKCVHKLWKARVAGYEEAMKLFNQIDDEKSSEWNKYLGLIKKFVTDSNAVAQEKGLEAAMAFVENCGHAGKTAGEVMSGIVTKCLAAPRTKTKELALLITLRYIEIEKHEVVQEELLKGMEQKNPKVVAACVSTLNTALKQFGNKVILIKPIVKKIPILLADRDKTVRDEMKALVIEMQRWIGPAIEPHIASLQAVVQQELREAFSIGDTATPTRYLGSQQPKITDTPMTDAADGTANDEDMEAASGDNGDTDAFDLLDPVEILSKLPKDFYEKLEAKKWQERKEALDALEVLLKIAPRLEPGDYADLVRALKKVISKDTNVMLVASGGRLLAMVATGLRNKFQPYAVVCIQAVLEKFKERKPNVVAVLREAVDAMYPSTNLEAIMEDMLAAFDNKNPSIKAESAMFLSRALCHTQPAAFNKKLIKAYVAGLLKLLDSADPAVRDAAAEALGTATKLVGEKNIAPHIGKIDNLKEQKIREFAEKAVIQVKMAAPNKQTKAKEVAPTSKGDGKTSQAKSGKRPATGSSPKKAVVKKPATVVSKPQEEEMPSDHVDEIANQLLTEDVVTNLGDSSWKTRLAAVQAFQQAARSMNTNYAPAQLLYRTLNKKPGLKDSNVHVLKARLELCKHIADNFPISTTAASFILHDVVAKLGDSSCTTSAAACLTSLAEACGLEYILNEGLAYAMDSQKNPKVQSEMWIWSTNAIKEFGFNMDIKSVVMHSKKALSAAVATVRSSAVEFLSVLSMYVGSTLITHFDSEKPGVKQLLSLEMDKYANTKPPKPTRQTGAVSKSESKGSVVEDDHEEEEESAPPTVEDSRPKTDIAPLLTESLLAEINDKNWKVRNEGLEKLKTLITTNSPIKSSLGDLPVTLVARVLDTNSKLAQTALQICELLANAMGPRCKQHAKTLMPIFFQAFGDGKQWIRAAASSCVDAWCRAAGPTAIFDGEIVAEALKSGSPILRGSVLSWLAEYLPNVPLKSISKEEISICIPSLYHCLEDRSADVRKVAGDCVLPFMLHLGYDSMHKQLGKLKPGSKTVVQAALDKARPMLPVQPLPAKTKKEEPRNGKTTGGGKKESDKKTTATAKGKALAKPAATTNRGKKEDDDCTPLLPNNNAKKQRIVDDQKLKVLKWNFTTPRDEFFDLLKEQMTVAGLNKQLVGNMFHCDFRYHLKAIESLSEDLQENGPALMANLDLVLKWLTLRFFDTNPSVILKGLEYLSLVFQYLMDSDYTMAEYEANCFIPYLVLKVGDPKDTVRNGVKALFKQICVVYSVTKLFGYLMEGLKSKNARQRAECLECIGHLLETYGMGVMSPSSGPALKELARHIGDRDNAVRSAALNCIASAYFLEGEKIYKMIGQISDKDLSLLEERIKRAGKNRNAEARRSMLTPLSSTGKPILQAEECLPQEEPPRRVISVEVSPSHFSEEEEEREEDAPPPINLPVVEPRVVTGPFGLDPKLIAELDAISPVLKKPVLQEPDLAFLSEPVPVPISRKSVRTSAFPTAPGQMMQNVLATPHHTVVDVSQLADIIHSISSPDLNVAMRSLSLISGAMVSGRAAALVGRERDLVAAIAAQVRNLRTRPGPVTAGDVLPAYKYLAAALITFYETAKCGWHVDEPTLRLLFSELLRVLGAAEGVTVDPGLDGDRLVRVLNNLCVRILEHSTHTVLVCTLITLLHETIGVSEPAYPRYQDLMLKCFWKTIKMLPEWDVDTIDFDSVIYKIHVFYEAYPIAYWKSNPQLDDTPNRTVKTLVHTLVKVRGSAITDNLSQIPDLNKSELYSYLLKVMKTLKVEVKRDNSCELKKENLPDAANGAHIGAGRLPRAAHEELAAILKRIGSKDHSKDALEQLYDLRERHPEVDIWTFMPGSSFYFRNYLERALKEVAEQRKVASYKRDFKADSIDISNEFDDKSHLVFLERLRVLQAKAGLKPARSPSTEPRTPTGDHENNATRPHSIDPQLEANWGGKLNTSPSPMPQRDEAAVEALRLKLEQIKSSSNR